MDAINTLLLFAGLLLFVSVLGTALARYGGVPLLLVFLGMGMLAGEDGLGQIDFDDFGTAFLIGNLALAIILLDGGLRTRYRSFRVGLRPALSLASVGVVVTAVLVGGFITWLLGLDWRYALLLGTIVGSTDAAAVFSQLREGGVSLNERVTATLEIESGTNDPMAIFLVLFLLEALTGPAHLSLAQLPLELLVQFGLGAAGGIALGFGLSFLVARLRLAEGLYALLIASGGLFAFALINHVGGSGFLGIYLLGLVVGNRRNHATEHVMAAMDGLAWLAQAGMFLMLGLLVNPSNLIDNGVAAGLTALFLIFVARPAAVFAALAPFRFPVRERLFISWVGLRGAVPIVLALFPMVAGLSGARFLFDITFAVVLISLLLQGSTIGWVADLLRLRIPNRAAALDMVELETGSKLRFVLLQFKVEAGASIEGRGTSALPQHRRVRCVATARAGRLLFSHQKFNFAAGDRVFVIAPARHARELAQLFRNLDRGGRISPRRFYGSFVLQGSAPLAGIAQLYGAELPPEAAGQTLGEFIRARLNREPVEGDTVALTELQFRVRSLRNGKIDTVGLDLGAPEAGAAARA